MNAATAEKYEAVCRPAFGRETYAGILEFARCCVPCVEKVVFTVVETTLPDEDIELCRRTAESLGASFRVRPLDTGTETRWVPTNFKFCVCALEKRIWKDYNSLTDKVK